MSASTSRTTCAVGGSKPRSWGPAISRSSAGGSSRSHERRPALLRSAPTVGGSGRQGRQAARAAVALEGTPIARVFGDGPASLHSPAVALRSLDLGVGRPVKVRAWRRVRASARMSVSISEPTFRKGAPPAGSEPTPARRRVRTPLNERRLYPPVRSRRIRVIWSIACWASASARSLTCA
jgi:hypothetical protein